MAHCLRLPSRTTVNVEHFLEFTSNPELRRDRTTRETCSARPILLCARMTRSSAKAKYGTKSPSKSYPMSWLIASIAQSITALKMKLDRGSPCRTPWFGFTLLLNLPPDRVRVQPLSYSPET